MAIVYRSKSGSMRTLLTIFVLIFVSSCSRMGLEKRRYNPGYYHELSSGRQVEKKISPVAEQSITNSPIQDITVPSATSDQRTSAPKQTSSSSKISTITISNKTKNISSGTQHLKEKLKFISNYHQSKPIKNLKHRPYYGGDSCFSVLVGALASLIFYLLMYGLMFLFPMMSAGVAAIIVTAFLIVVVVVIVCAGND